MNPPQKWETCASTSVFRQPLIAGLCLRKRPLQNPVAADDPHRSGSQWPAVSPHRIPGLQIKSPRGRRTSAAVVNPPDHVHERDDLIGSTDDRWMEFPSCCPLKKRPATKVSAPQNLVHQRITPTFLAFFVFLFQIYIYISTNST